MVLDERLLLRLPIILLALTIHELAHGWSAYKLGDPTAKDQGRLTLNPIPHLDFLGTIMLLAAPIGWAKPVPVNPYNLRKPKRDLMIVSFAGPLSNMILAVCFALAISILTAVSPQHLTATTEAAISPSYLWKFLEMAFMINVGLAFFNMLPFYPLDGSKVVAGFLPDSKIEPYMKATRYALPGIFGLAIAGYLIKIPLLSIILMPALQPFFRFMQLVSFGNADGLNRCWKAAAAAAGAGI
ncbi:MAG: site-2 protease family protein [Chitinispirillia bacterium]|nr:site-2 protease family protein [Chitinispirillia bacterium]